ncbi:unnamed protein product [Didymodactylos carnosus]|uniref:Uncharacterized protein n=1 Tax=Didymodactylos carnosus TaxID=1234261 RepID=A0A814I9Y6_9BILA|nr:unnamed protein product [Didymodactylos carnosus]CAF3791493.1 unnamed protein product [Didymodactylos carnosus]
MILLEFSMLTSRLREDHQQKFRNMLNKLISKYEIPSTRYSQREIDLLAITVVCREMKTPCFITKVTGKNAGNSFGLPIESWHKGFIWCSSNSKIQLTVTQSGLHNPLVVFFAVFRIYQCQYPNELKPSFDELFSFF